MRFYWTRLHPTGRCSVSLTVCLCVMVGALGCEPTNPSDPDTRSTDDGDTAAVDTRDAADSDTNDTGDTGDAEADVSDTGEVSDDDGEATDTSRSLKPQTLSIPALAAPVTVRYDESGALHIDCQRPQDCFTAQGYFHAYDRFWTMDLARRQIRGQLSQMFGLKLASNADKQFRRIMSTRDGESLPEAYAEKMNQQTRAMMEAYADGVNAWLDDLKGGKNGVELPEEYDFPALSGYNAQTIRDWEVADTASLYLRLAYSLGGYWAQRESTAGSLVAELGIGMVRDLFTNAAIESTTIGAAGGSRPLSGSRQPIDPAGGLAPEEAEQLRRRMASANDLLERTARHLAGHRGGIFPTSKLGSPPGMSNNWVLAPSRTKTGDVLLANDPHSSGLSNPSRWYYVEMHAQKENPRGLHIAGASVPGAPGVVVGQNEDIAWGTTQAILDLTDVYIETLTEDGTAVKRNGNTIDIRSREVTLTGKQNKQKTVTFEWVPGHGPIIEKDVDEGTAVTVKWVAHRPGKDLNFLPKIFRAQSVDEAREAFETIRIIAQNWVVGDSEGNIGWYPMSKVPDRSPWVSPETPNWLPLPGDGSAEWNGFISYDKLPSLTNPPSGFIATANNDIDGSFTDKIPSNEDSPPIQAFAVDGFRHHTIVSRLRASKYQTVDSMKALQHSTFVSYAKRLVPELLKTATDVRSRLSPAGKNLIGVLEQWNFTCPSGVDGGDPEKAPAVSDRNVLGESSGCSAFHTMLVFLTAEIFEDELNDVGNLTSKTAFSPLQSVIFDLFVQPSRVAYEGNYFDDQTTESEIETRADAVVAAFDKAGASLERRFGTDDDREWLWGRIFTRTLTSALSNFGSRQYSLGPFARHGGWETLNKGIPSVKSRSPIQFGSGSDVGTRLVFRLGDDGVEGHFQLPGGQVHDRDSPYYNSLLSNFKDGTYSDLHFTREAVKQNAEIVVDVSSGN